MSRTSKLTTTSYAILGLLAIKPWAPYELTQQMKRSLGRFWPRAESKLYEEPKKLVAHGLAEASPDLEGSRPRTMYVITANGRRALAEWLAEPGAGPVLEWEQLLKVFLAEHGSTRDLLTTLATAQAWADKHVGEDAAVAHAYLSGQGPFPERTPQLVLVGRFLSDFAEMTARWAEWATGIVEAWPDDPASATPHWETLEEIARRGNHAQALADQHVTEAS